MKSRREQIAEARRLGIIVRPVRRTGEVRFIGPDGDPPVTMNNRRKDGSKAVEKLIEKARREKPDSD